MKKTLTTIALALSSIAGFAQQDPQFTQYMYNKLFMNPAYAGMRQALCASYINRQQWTGFDGAPKTGDFAVDIFLPKLKGGLGLTLMHDKLGFENTMAYRLQYSFHIPLSNSTIGIGIEAGAISKRIGPTGTNSWIATTTWQNDPSIPPQLKKTTYDLGLGLWYQRQNMWFGVSSTHLAAQPVNDGTLVTLSPGPATTHNLIYNLARHYYVTGGVNFEAGSFVIRPSFLVKTDATITQFDLNVNALWNERFWFGATYRYQDAISPMIGFQLPGKDNPESGLKVGFAYDYTTSNLNNYTNGTFELFLNYCIPIVTKIRREGHGDVRIFN